MSNQQPQQQSLYSLQMLREQALNPQVDPREILAALLPHLEGMESIQQQLADAQAQTHAQAQAQSQSQAHNQPIHEAVQAMASMQQTYSHYHQQSQKILNTLSHHHHMSCLMTPSSCLHIQTSSVDHAQTPSLPPMFATV